MTFTTMMAGFLIVPNMPGYITGNLRFPADQLQWLYLVGGLTTVVTIPLVGRLVDRFGSFRVGVLGVAMNLVLLFAIFYEPQPVLPGLGLTIGELAARERWSRALVFVAFMTGMSFRNVAYNTLTSKVPSPDQRARFNSLQSSVGHLASASGSFLSAAILGQTVARPLSTGSASVVAEPLVGMGRVAMASMVLASVLPFLLWQVESRVRARRGAPTGQGQPRVQPPSTTRVEPVTKEAASLAR
jgi:MFS family permease